MNSHDKQNLDFLLNVEPDILSQWWSHISEDDRRYAQELLTEYSHILVERQLSMMSIYPDAAVVIDRVR